MTNNNNNNYYYNINNFVLSVWICNYGWVADELIR